jgi:hypothetical protein
MQNIAARRSKSIGSGQRKSVPSNPVSQSAKRASAASCLNPGQGSGLVLPSLSNITPEYSYLDKNACYIDLLKGLVRSGVAPATKENRRLLAVSPLSFAEESFDQWIRQRSAQLGKDIVYSFVIAAPPDDIYCSEKIAAPLVLSAYCDQADYVAIGRFLEALEKQAKGLGSAFFFTFVDSIMPSVRVFDYRDAEYYVEMITEGVPEEELESCDLPNVEGAIPAYIKAHIEERRKKSKKTNGNTSFKTLRANLHGPYGKWIAQLLDIKRLSEQRTKDNAVDAMVGCFDGEIMPSLILVFDRNDDIGGCADQYFQDWLSVDHGPCFAMAFDPAKLDDVQRALNAMDNFLALNRAFHALCSDIEKWTSVQEKREKAKKPTKTTATIQPLAMAA